MPYKSESATVQLVIPLKLLKQTQRALPYEKGTEVLTVKWMLLTCWICVTMKSS